MSEKIGHEISHLQSESQPEAIVVPPAIESLLHIESAKSPWPSEIQNNPELKKHCAERLSLSQKFSALYGEISRVDMDTTEALKSGVIDKHAVIEFYDALTDILKQDPANNRIALYLPFELLPKEGEISPDDELSRSTERFTKVYRSAWEALLREHDLRADFVDGDIPEIEQRTSPLPQVVKAAHLIPKLVERGLITPHEVLTLMEDTSDNILRDSIADTLPVLADLDLLPEEEIERMALSQNRMVVNMATIIRANRAVMRETSETSPTPDDCTRVAADLRDDIARITETLSDEHSDQTEARRKWLAGVATERALATGAQRLARTLSDGSQSPDDLIAYSTTHKDAPDTLLIIHTILQTLTEGTKEDAAKNYQSYEALLAHLWAKRDGDVHDALERTFLHLFTLHIVDGDTLERFGITVPLLDASFSERTDTIKGDTEDLGKIAASIESHSELSNMIYPVAVVLGSRMKGYAKESADFDVAVFVRPNVSFEERAHLQSLIQEVFADDKIQGHAMEFWLEENGDGLSIRNFENPDSLLGDNTLTHPLQGAWCGNESSIRELYEKLMPGYLYSQGKTILKEDARTVWLRDMEHNTLQYRLMHKGYERFSPRQGGINTPHSDEIDGASTFYDSGYRRLATKLFVDRVFLPQLEKPTIGE